MNTTSVVTCCVSALLFAGSAAAQNRGSLPPDEQSKYIVSAKPGVVSLVDGKAFVRSQPPSSTPRELAAGYELRMYDTVRTEAAGRLEILLNPGCYLRLGRDSELLFAFDGIDKNQITLRRGSAVIEASVDDLILIGTPKAQLEITRSGLYRFTVNPDGSAEVAVRKGRVLVGNITIKSGKRASVEGELAAIGSIDKKERDELDDWSKERAKALIAANRQLSNSLMLSSFNMSFPVNAWVYDPFCRCYTFLPYDRGFASPYGWTYAICNPYWYYAPGYDRWRGGGPAGGGPRSGSGGGGSTGGYPRGGSGGGGSTGGGSAGGGPSRPAPTPSHPGPRGGDREVMPIRRP